MTDNNLPVLDLQKETPEYVSRNIARLITQHGGVRIMNGGKDHGVFDANHLASVGLEDILDELDMIADPEYADVFEPDTDTYISGEEYFRRNYGARYWEDPALRARIKNLPIPAGVKID